MGAVSLFFGIAQGISRLRRRPEGMKTNEVCGRPLETFALHSHVSWFSLLKVERACGRCFGIVLANFLCC